MPFQFFTCKKAWVGLKVFVAVLAAFVPTAVNAQNVDYSVVLVPEESGLNLTKITSDNDYVCMPEVRRDNSGVYWMVNKTLDLTSDGKKIAFLSFRGNCSNIFVKELSKQSSGIQRTNRSMVTDFSYSDDNRKIVFSEKMMNANAIFLTDASNGFVCRQITNGSQDCSPRFTPDNSAIIFTRTEARASSIWSYNLSENYLSTFSGGMNPYPLKRERNTYLCIRVNGFGKGEIWKINYVNGIEECLVSDVNRSFSTPSISPDGEWVLFVGSSAIPTDTSVYWNTDIFACRKDGSQLTQLTYHAADDLCPGWSADGKSIYFISQRGSASATANIWKISFNL